MIPREELLLRLLAKLSESRQPLTYTKIQKSAYLLDQFMQEKFGKGTSYSFDQFLAHSGPYDEELQSCIDTWLMVGLLRDEGSPVVTEEGPSKYFKTHHLRITEWGKVYLSNSIAALIQEYWGKNSTEEIERFFLEISDKPESILMREASEAWAKKHPEKKVEMFVKSFPDE